MADVIAKLMRAAEAAEAAARATLVSPEEERVIIDAAEALAGSDAGVPAKTRAVVLQLETKWLVFLDKHGAEYKWDAEVGPTLELVKHFQTWGFFHRQNYSTLGCDGMGDSWGQLAVPYLLPKYVFAKLGYKDWAKLDMDALHAKCRPYVCELRDNWKRLTVSHVRSGTGNGRVLKKERWCDGLLFRAQDRCMAEVLRVNRAVTRLAVMGFVKVTCSRGGAFARDWADRAEKQVRRRAYAWRDHGHSRANHMRTLRAERRVCLCVCRSSSGSAVTC